MNLKAGFLSLALAVSVGSVFGALTVDCKDGAFSVLRDGQVIVSSLAIETGEKSPAKAKTSFDESPRFGKVWNVWNDRRDGRYRLEVAQRPDGVVEITMAGQVDPYDEFRSRMLRLFVPAEVLEGKKWDGLSGTTRRWIPQAGTFAEKQEKLNLRWLVSDGLIFDFNPLGGADWASGYTSGAVKGTWQVIRAGKFYRMSGGSYIRGCGGFTGAKILIREGTFADYHTYHFVPKHSYPDHLDHRALLAFGGSRHGKAYADGDVPYAADRGFGWVSDERRERVLGAADGALYSCVKGRDGTYRFTGLPDGFYAFTVEAGNFTGAANAFSVSVNGETIAANKSVAKGTARQFARAVRVTGGTADVRLKGDYLLSVIGVQPVLGDGEDFSVNRGFWCIDGYEPGIIYRNDEAKPKAVFRAVDETYDLPVQGTETAGPRRDPPAPVLLPDPATPSLRWLERGKVVKILSNSSTLAELDDPAALRRFVGERTDGKDCSAVMISGMHSRHTYEAHLERGREAVRRIAAEVHRRGMKLFDHHDATLLWNIDAGLRVLMERLPETIRSKDDGLPSFQLCLNNPAYKETYYAYLRGQVEAGVDGFQIDEIEFFRHGCVCAACRKRFHDETGWFLPVNELDAALNDPTSPLRKRWHEWRVKTVTNWFVELRRRLMDIKPDLVINMYTTHWGFTSSLPDRGGSSDLIDLGRTVNFFGTEVMPRNLMLSGRALLPHRRTKHLLRKAYGTPLWAWFYGSARPQYEFSWAIANMCGQIPLLPDIPPDPSAPDCLAFAASPANMDFIGCEPLARVALLFSSHSRDWSPHWKSAAEHFGTAQALEAGHVPYEVIGEMNLDERTLSKYRILFVGDSECLSDREIAAIRAFAERGGTVRLAALAGVRDEIGELRSSWPFGDVFGFVPYEGKDAAVVAKPLGRGTVVYDPTRRGQEFAFRELDPQDVNRYDPDPVREAAFWADMAEFTKNARMWRTDAPSRVYTSLWRERGGDVIIHFLNAMGGTPPVGTVMPDATPDPPFPEIGRDITFTIRAAGVKSVTAASPDFAGVRKLDFVRHEDGSVTVTLQKGLLTAYTLVRLSEK